MQQTQHHINTFVGGMDHQTEDRSVEPIDYRLLMNADNTGTTDASAIKEAWGNIAISNQWLLNGNNKCIGVHLDRKTGCIIYCVYNSLGYHGIFLYNPALPPYNNGVIQRIYQVTDPSIYNDLDPNPLNFFNDHEYLVTSMSLVDGFFFFSDYKNRSKFIDIDRANNAGKKLQFKLVFNRNSLTQTSNYTLNLFKPAGLVHTTIWTSSATTIQDRVKDFVATYNQQPSPHYTIQAFPEYVIFTMSVEGSSYLTISENTSTPAVILAHNFYPEKDNTLPFSWKPVTWQLFDRLVHTGLLQPTVTYKTDTSRQINLIRNKVFQFKYAIQYFDNSKSVYTANSKIPIPSYVDFAAISLDSNYIEIVFDDPVFSIPERVSLIKSVEILMNEPAVDTKWKTVKTLDQHEFAGIQMQSWNFFNDGSYAEVPDAIAIKQFDSLPITHKSEEVVDNRIFVGGTLEGYNKPDVNFKVTPQITDSDVQGYAIRGRIRITNPRSNIDPFLFRRLFTDVEPPSSTPFYGGYAFLPLFPGSPGYVRDIAQYYRQWADFGGWTAYLAGTDYFDTSKQKYVGAPNQNADGIFDFNSTTAVRQTITWIFLNQGAIYSEFEIKNVPDGEYLLRFSASAYMAPYGNFFADRNYEQTSAPFYNVGGTGNTEIAITVNGADVTINDSFIEDLTSPSGATSTSFQIYISDNDFPGGTTLPDLWNNTRIHKAQVALGFGSTALLHVKTDHNGFCFGGAPDYLTPSDLTVLSIHSGQYSFTPVAPPNPIAFDLTTQAPWGFGVADGTGKIGIFQCNSANIRNFSRSLVQGNFIGQQRSGISVTPSYAQPVVTDSNGDFQFKLYADTSFPYPTNNGTNNVSLFFASDVITTILTFLPTNSSVNLNLNVNNEGTNTPKVLTSLFSNTIISSLLSKVNFKGGYDTIIGMVYYDEGDRKTGVCIMPGKPTNIPFYSAYGNIFNAQIKVEIFNEPPPESVKYHVVRLRNMQQSSFLQWAINKVVYVEPDLTTTGPYSSGATRFAKINLDNIGYYSTNLHPGANLNYTPSAGDRLRLIASPAGVVYNQTPNQTFEYEVVTTVGNDVFIEKDNALDLTQGGVDYGHVFEIYSPRSKAQTDFYFEIGEGYPILTGTFNGIKKRYHAGNVQNQAYGPLPGLAVTPAIIVTDQGGTYKRIRQIPVNNNTQFVNWLVDAETISDFYPSLADGTGRPNIDNPAIKQTSRPTAIRFGNLYFAGTLVNGLRNYEPLNEKQLSTVYGLIQKMILVNNNVLKVICNNSYMLSMYINQAVLRTATGQNLVAFSDDVLSKQHQMERSFGTQHPESITINDEGDVFGWDESAGIYWRSSGNALIDISDYKLTPTFKKLADSRLQYPIKYRFAPSVYHVYKDELITAFNRVEPPPIEPAFGIFEIPYFDSSLVASDAAIIASVTIAPTNQVLFSGNVNEASLFPDIASAIIGNINKTTLTTGWSAELTPLGFVKIVAPVDYPYPNAAIVITINYTNLDGTPGQFSLTFNLNNLVPSTGEDYQQGVPPLTISFQKESKNQIRNRWLAEYEFYPEYFGQLKSNFVSFVNGALFLHSEKAAPNTWYGVYHPTKLQFLVNPVKDAQKIFKSIEANINNNDTYYPTLITPVDELNPLGMTTEITKQHIRNIQGKLYSNIPKDKNTPGMPSVNEAWVNGRDMSGQVLIVTLVNDGAKKFKLLDCRTGYILSEYSL